MIKNLIVATAIIVTLFAVVSGCVSSGTVTDKDLNLTNDTSSIFCS